MATNLKRYYFTVLMIAGMGSLGLIETSLFQFSEIKKVEFKTHGSRGIASIEESTGRITLDDLDRIMQEAGSTQGFVSNRALQDRYYEALKDYMGSERYIPRESFNAIVQDLGLHLGEVKGLGERLWETTNTGKPISMKASIARSGRRIGQGWDEYQRNLRKDLDNLSTDFMKPSADGVGAVVDKAKMREFAKEFNQKASAHEASVAGLPRKKRVMADAEFFKGLQADRAYRAYTAAALKNFFAVEKIQDAFGNNDADVILDNLRSIRQKPNQVLSYLDEDLRINNGATGIRNMVPAPEALTNEVEFKKMLAETRKELNRKLPTEGLEGDRLRHRLGSRDEALKAAIDKFNKEQGKTFPVDYKFDEAKRVLALPQAGSKETINLRPIPRRIHGIFKGVMDRECVGGSCTYLNSLSIERWATPAVKDTQLYNVEADGKYKGFVQVLPIKVKGRVYGSVDWGSSLLRNKIQLEGEAKKRPLVEPVIERLNNVMPKSMGGLVMGSSYDVDNARVKEVAEASQNYIAGRVVGDINDFEHIDKDFVNRVVNRPKKRNHGFNYDGSMVFDGSGRSGGEYRVLASRERIRKIDQLIDRYLQGEQVVEKLSVKNRQSFAEMFVHKLGDLDLAKYDAQRIADRLKKDFPRNIIVQERVSRLESDILFGKLASGEVRSVESASEGTKELLSDRMESNFKALSEEEKRRALPKLVKAFASDIKHTSDLWSHFDILPEAKQIELAEKIVGSYDPRFGYSRETQRGSKSINLIKILKKAVDLEKLEEAYLKRGAAALRGIKPAHKKALLNHILETWPAEGRSSRYPDPLFYRNNKADLAKIVNLAEDFSDVKWSKDQLANLIQTDSNNWSYKKEILFGLLKDTPSDSLLPGRLVDSLGEKFNKKESVKVIQAYLNQEFSQKYIEGDFGERLRREKIAQGYLMPDITRMSPEDTKRLLPKAERMKLLWEFIDKPMHDALRSSLVFFAKDRGMTFNEQVEFADRFLRKFPEEKKTFKSHFGRRGLTKLMVGVRLRRAGICFQNPEYR